MERKLSCRRLLGGAALGTAALPAPHGLLHPMAVAGLLAGLAVMYVTGLLVSV